MTRLRKATLSDVATRAGVSTTTASYILNGRSAQMRISPETEQRVRDAITELAYRPNRNARSLRTASTSTIGIITDFIASGMFSSQMLSGANRAARRADHLLVIGESEGDARARDLLIDEMLDRQVDGIIYATRRALRTELPASLRGTRVVMLNCYDALAEIPSVLPDNRLGGRHAADALLDAGIDTGVYVVGEAPEGEEVAGFQRLRGIREGFAERDLQVAGLLECRWGPSPAYAVVHHFLRSGHVPRGLICMNDRTAMGAYQALAEAGLEVPRDVAVVSFDASQLATWLRPTLTSVALPLRAMGARAVKLLLEGDPDGTDPVHLVPMNLRTGDSVASHVALSDA